MLKFLRGSSRTAAIWWLVIIGTSVTFVLGFSVAPNLVGGGPVAGSAELGEVNGHAITQAEFQQTVAQALSNFRAQQGRDPDEREEGLIREQAWAQIVTEKALVDEARRMGFGSSDPEVVFAIRNTPPPWVRSQEVFQTNGQFDVAKYHAALSDPSVNWSPLEDEMRRLLPAQKLEEMILSTAKFSEPQLRRAFVAQYEKARVTFALWGPAVGAPDTSGLDDAALRKFYDANPARFAGPEEVRAELVTIPKQFLPDDEQLAQQQARSLTEQARAGADFTQLARDMSGGPLADRGGYMGVFGDNQMPPQILQAVQGQGDSVITDPIREGDRFFVFKAAQISPGSYALWQIQIPITASPEAQQKDFEQVQKLRKAAESRGLGPAAARMGMASQETGWFNIDGFSPQLANLPEGQQFAAFAKVGKVSPAYDRGAQWVVVQVKARRPAGVRPFEDVKEEVKVAMIRERQLAPAREAAKRARALVDQGVSLEEAAQREGATQTHTTEFFSRQSPDGRLGGSPRAVGMAFALNPGEIGGPVESQLGVFVMRKDGHEPAPEERFDELKGQISQQLLTERQNRRFADWLGWYRDRSKIVDRRAEVLGFQ